MSQNTTQTTLESNAEIGSKPIGSVLDGTETEDHEVLGHMIYSCTGEVIVSAQWLSDKFRQYDVPRYYLPDLPHTWSAYNRAMRYLVQEGVSDSYTVNGREVNVEMRRGKGKAKFIEAHEFVPERESNVEDGEWRKTTLGKINYDKEQQETIYESLMEDYRLADIWGSLVSRSEQLFSRLQGAYIDTDLRKVMQEIRTDASSVTLRDAGVVYFVPAHAGSLIESVSHVWNDMENAHSESVEKMGGQKSKEIEMRTGVVINVEEERQAVQRQVEKKLEEEVDDALTKAFNQFTDDESIDEIITEVLDSVEYAEDITEEYNQLLDTRLSVRRTIEQRAEEMADAKHEEFVEELEDEINE